MKTKANTMKPKSGVGLHDILFILFKHKWKILLLTLLGFAGAGALIFKVSRSPHYESNAELLVRYVLVRENADGFETRESAGGRGGESVMETELAIIKSVDLAMEVAEKIGPERLLPNSEEPPTVSAAANALIEGLEVVAARGSSLIQVSYRNPDPELAVEVLDELIDAYFVAHLAIHRSTGDLEKISRDTDLARNRVRETEAELARLKAEAGVFSVVESMSALEARRNIVNDSLLVTQAALAGQKTKVASLEESLGVPKARPDDEAELAALSEKLDQAALAQQKELKEDNAKALAADMELAKAVAEFRDLEEQVSRFKAKRDEILVSRPGTDPMSLSLNRMIDEAETDKFALVKKFPQLANLGGKKEGVTTQLVAAPSLDEERAYLAELEAKLTELIQQAAAIQKEVLELSSLGTEITALERRLAMEEEKHRYLEINLDKAQVDNALSPVSMPNIGIVQKPTTAKITIDKMTQKLALGLSAGGLILGVSLAFLIELVVDRRVSRSTEIQTRLQLPLMMSIPRIRSNDSISKLIGHQPGLELYGDAGDVVLPPITQVNGRDLATNDSAHFITPYAAAIRDRIMFNFELNNITHKPKLVALTGLSAGAGTSTLAAGLAKAFCEHGNQKVLLVDLNPAPCRSQLEWRPDVSLRRALEVSKADRFRESTRRLYYASAPTNRETRGAYQLAPSGLFELIPHLTASDFDYIIFDMPPIDPTSPTLAMAGFMDKVLLVLDAEKTNREELRWGYSELERGRADVSCVFNKAKSHAPRWVEGSV